jgi:hypothetical protein
MLIPMEESMYVKTPGPTGTSTWIQISQQTVVKIVYML